MTFSQRLLKFFSSKSGFEKAKAESQQWGFDCECGKRVSIWDAGGIRYKARGEPLIMLRCPSCAAVKMRKITRDQSNSW